MNRLQPYQRILLKLSGESLMAEQQPTAIFKDSLNRISLSVKDLCNNNIQVGIVIGAGNIFRGNLASSINISQIPADYMGMMATLINAIALEQALEQIGQKAIVMSAIPAPSIVEPYCWQKAIHELEKGTVTIFAGGTGNPFFTTDTAAALRASEIRAQILLKATKVDGVYTKDPMKHKDAVRYPTISFKEALEKNLQIMDATALTLCMASSIPVLIFNMWETTRFSEILKNPSRGTQVYL